MSEQEQQPSPYRTVRADEIRKGDTVVNFGIVTSLFQYKDGDPSTIGFRLQKASGQPQASIMFYKNEAVVINPKP